MQARAQRGAALITALLLAALAAVMVSGMMWHQWGAIQQEQAQRQATQARWILRGAVDWARLILNQAARESRTVSLEQPWAVPLAESDLSRFLAGGGQVPLRKAWLEGRIEDAQGRFNLTDLALFGKPNPAALDILRRICRAAAVNPSVAEQMAQALADGQKPAGSALPIRELQDFARVSPMVAEALPRLATSVTVLPNPTPINANTASAQVLAAVLDLSPDQAARLVSQRQAHPFDNLQQVRDALGVRGAAQVDPAVVDVRSDFFFAVARVRLDDFEYAQQALIQRIGVLSQVLRMQRVAPWLADPATPPGPG